MKLNNKLICLFGFLMITISLAKADDVKRISSQGPVDILAVIGKANEIYFENGISTLVRSGIKGTVDVEQIGSRLFVTPKADNPADITVIDSQDHSLKLHFIFNQGFDEKISINSSSVRDSSQSSENSIVGIIRDLVKGKTPKGSTEKPSNQVVFDNGQIRLHLITIYEMPQLLCYIMEVENLLNQSVIVPVQQMTFPNLLAVGSSKDLLKARGTEGSSSKVYMVIAK